MAVEVRYLGNRNKFTWGTENWNERTLIENGMYDEFLLARDDLPELPVLVFGEIFRALAGDGDVLPPLRALHVVRERPRDAVRELPGQRRQRLRWRVCGICRAAGTQSGADSRRRYGSRGRGSERVPRRPRPRRSPPIPSRRWRAPPCRSAPGSRRRMAPSPSRSPRRTARPVDQ